MKIPKSDPNKKIKKNKVGIDASNNIPKDKDAKNVEPLERARQLAFDFRKYLHIEISINALRTKDVKSGFTKLVQRNRSRFPLYFTGALWKGSKQLPTLSQFKAVTGQKFDIGKYIYMAFTGFGFLVGFKLDAIYTTPSKAPPFDKKRKKQITVKQLLLTLEKGGTIPLTKEVMRFYFAILRQAHIKKIRYKKEDGYTVKKNWRIPARPFWNAYLRKFKDRHARETDIIIRENKGIPYSVYIEVKAGKQPKELSLPTKLKKKKL